MVTPRIANGTAAVALLGRWLHDVPHERLIVAHLDERRGLIAVRAASDGDGERVAVPLRAIVADALALDSRGVVLAHNHPSGDARPSRADLSATRTIVGLLAGLGIRLHDHLIFAGDRCCSFKALRLL